MRSPAVALAMVLVVAAGCVGRDAPAAGPPQEPVTALESDRGPARAGEGGTVRGAVHDAALTPVANASLELPRASLRARTDHAGHFELAGVPAGEHLLTVEAPGYHTRSVSIQAHEGATVQLDVLLERAAVLEPYVETRELQGFLACAALVAGERPDCASADPNHRDIFEFELAEGGLGVVVELAWDADSTPAAPRMTLFAETVGYGAQDLDLGNATGAGYARVEVPRSVMEKYYPEGGVMRARVALAEGSAPAAVAAQASFTVFVSAFYHHEAPSGASVVG